MDIASRSRARYGEFDEYVNPDATLTTESSPQPIRAMVNGVLTLASGRRSRIRKSPVEIAAI
jgi:hypothetical protein